MSEIANQIRGQLDRYLRNTITVEALNREIVPLTWNIRSYHDREAESLAYAVELLLAEFSAGHRTEDEFRRHLQPLMAGYEVTISLVTGFTQLIQKVVSTRTSSVTLFPERRPYSPAGTQSVTVSA